MATSSEHPEIAAFFAEFQRLFAGSDGAALSTLFAAPGNAVRRDGTLRGFATRTDVAAYYQAALDRYASAGCRICRYTDLEIRAIGPASALATVSWDLLREDGAVVHHWRQAYLLARIADEWQILSSSFVSD